MTFWGVRGSVPVPGPTTVHYGGNTSCLEVRAGGEIIILDAGTGIRPLGRQLSQEFEDRPLSCTLLLSHTHWDHIQGLPFFQPVYRTGNRLRILGYEGARTSLNQVLSRQMESPYFPVNLPELPAHVQIEEFTQMSFAVGKVRVDATFANHPGRCLGYKLTTAGGSMAYFPDTESYLESLHSLGEDRAVRPAADVGREKEQQLIAFLRGVDVLVMDTQYDRLEYQEHVGWGHGCLDEVVDLAARAEVGTLFLFHHDPDHDDAKVRTMLEHARRLAAGIRPGLCVDAAREGLTVPLRCRAPGAPALSH